MSDWSSFENEKAYTDLWRGFIFEDSEPPKADPTQRGASKNVSYVYDDIKFVYSMPDYAKNFSVPKARQAVKRIIKKYSLTRPIYANIVKGLKSSFENITEEGQTSELSNFLKAILVDPKEDAPIAKGLNIEKAFEKKGINIEKAYDSLSFKDSLGGEFVDALLSYIKQKSKTVKNEAGYKIISLASPRSVLRDVRGSAFRKIIINNEDYLIHNFYIELEDELENEENRFFLAQQLGNSNSFTLSTDSPFLIQRYSLQEQEQPQNNQIVKNDIALLIKSMIVLSNPSEESLLTALRKIEKVTKIPEPDDDSFIDDELRALDEGVFGNIIDFARGLPGKVGQYFNKDSKKEMNEHFKLTIKTLVGAYLADKVLLELGLINKSQFLPGES